VGYQAAGYKGLQEVLRQARGW